MTGRTVGDRSRAILSVEYVFEGDGVDDDSEQRDIERRIREVKEAEEWAREEAGQAQVAV